MFARKSNDNGATWLPDDALSDVISPLPAQPDSGIVGSFVGDYDYGSALATKHVTSWVDGRVPISGSYQQDAFTERELVGFAVTTTDPVCNSVINTQPVDYTINLNDAVDPSTVDATDFTVNGIPADSFVLGNGNQQITFHFNSRRWSRRACRRCIYQQVHSIALRTTSRYSISRARFVMACCSSR